MTVFLNILVKLIKNKLLRMSKSNKNIFFCFFVSQFLALVIYKNSYVANFGDHYHLILDIYRGNNVIYAGFPESPTFTIIGLLFSFKNFYIYSLLVYLVSSLLTYGTFKNLSFLNENLIFINFTGWMITISWWMGYVDIFLIYLSSYLVKLSNNKQTRKLTLFLLSGLIMFTHTGLGFFLLIIIHVLYFDFLKNKVNIILLGLIFGFILNQFYLQLIKYNFSQSRFSASSNKEILSSNIINGIENALLIFNSAIFIFSLLIIYLAFKGVFKFNKNIILAFSIAFLGSIILYDTSRYFSVLSLPIVVTLIDLNSNQLSIFKYKVQFLIFTIFWPKTHIWENRSYQDSPFYDQVTIYKIIKDLIVYFF